MIRAIVVTIGTGLVACASNAGPASTRQADAAAEASGVSRILSPETAREFALWAGSSGAGDIPEIQAAIESCRARGESLKPTVDALYAVLDEEWQYHPTGSSVRDVGFTLIVLEILKALRSQDAAAQAERRVWWPLPPLVVSDDPIPQRVAVERAMVVSVFVMRCGDAGLPLAKIRTDHPSSDVRNSVDSALDCQFGIH